MPAAHLVAQTPSANQDQKTVPCVQQGKRAVEGQKVTVWLGHIARMEKLPVSHVSPGTTAQLRLPAASSALRVETAAVQRLCHSHQYVRQERTAGMGITDVIPVKQGIIVMLKPLFVSYALLAEIVQIQPWPQLLCQHALWELSVEKGKLRASLVHLGITARLVLGLVSSVPQAATAPTSAPSQQLHQIVMQATTATRETQDVQTVLQVEDALSTYTHDAHSTRTPHAIE